MNTQLELQTPEPEQWDDREELDENVTQDEVSRAVVTDTDWTAETILSQLRRGNIQLNPRFQRRDAWDRSRKSRFIESLLLGLPIPQLVLAESRERRGAFLVLDGKQRLLTLRQFAAGSSVGDPVHDSEFDPITLRDLEVRKDLTGTSLSDLESNPDHLDDLNAFLNQPIRTVVVRNWPDEEFLNLVFLRLNTGSVSLSPQELRQALHPGPFTDFVDDYSSASDSIKRALRNRRPDFRMRDVEISLRFFGFRYFLDRYRGNLKIFLDETTGLLNDRWSSNEEEIRSVGERCDAAINSVFEIFESHSFYRWNGARYEKRFNRAVFDIMTYYLADARVAAEAVSEKQRVVDAFQRVCTENSRFVQSIQTTTKSIEATHLRLSVWGDELGRILDTRLSVPMLIDGRIVASSG